MRKKLTGKSTWFKKSRNEDDKDTLTGEEKSKSRKRKPVNGHVNRNPKKPRKEQDGSNMETTGVMFIDSTPHGVLCSRLQKCEDRLGVITGRRVKMVEMGGSQLSQLFSNTDP